MLPVSNAHGLGWVFNAVQASWSTQVLPVVVSVAECQGESERERRRKPTPSWGQDGIRSRKVPSSGARSMKPWDGFVRWRRPYPTVRARVFALDAVEVRPYAVGMASTTIKGTYSLDVETVQTLEEIARRWKVSKSEALRRAIQAAAAEAEPASEDPVQALDRLQKSLGLSTEAASRWEKRVRAERRAAPRRVKGR
jgi:hypothetical protein